MGVYFFDASAAVKRYAEETGTDWIRALTAPQEGHFLYIARISEVEVTAALARKRHQGAIDATKAGAALAQFRKDMAQDYRVVEVSRVLITRASVLADTHILRAYDAVQLAVALEILAIEPSLILVSADVDLNTAATAEGLPVEDPNDHP